MNDAARYVWAAVAQILIGAVVVVFVLWLRPLSDPATVIGEVARSLAPTIAATLAYMKSQETHLSVNSRLDTLMNDRDRAARAEGAIEGAKGERDRAAQIVAQKEVPK